MRALGVESGIGRGRPKMSLIDRWTMVEAHGQTDRQADSAGWSTLEARSVAEGESGPEIAERL